MKMTYKEYWDNGPPIERPTRFLNQTTKDPVKIVIEVELEKSWYEKRRAKYKEPIWEKVSKLFFG